MVAAVLLVCVLCGGSALAARGVRIARVDMSGYPTVLLTVVTPGDSSRPPALRENGLAAPGLAVVNLGGEESVVLAINHSLSMHGQSLVHALAASRGFLASKPNADRVSVFAFASQTLPLTGFSSTTTDADAALRSIRIDAHYGTSQWDSIVVAADALKADGSPGRTIIMITDGQDTTSKATLRQAITAARQAQVAVYPIAIKDATFYPHLLQKLAAGTGGKMFIARPNEPLTGIYNAIASELKHTWQLSYLTAARPGDTLSLTVDAPDRATATTSVTALGSTATPTTHSPTLSLTEIAMMITALIVLVLAAPRILRTARDIRIRRGWDGFD